VGFTQTLDKPKCIGVGAVQAAISMHGQGIEKFANKSEFTG
jgi:hypothetical protein